MNIFIIKMFENVINTHPISIQKIELCKDGLQKNTLQQTNKNHVSHITSLQLTSNKFTF